ncbi:MAG: ABC transporter permease [Clostridia bacterium]|nr:ABC transporter permease [Clostridia bacterium]
MKSSDFVKMGFKNLWRRKLRTILTVMGVVIGTFSIVIMMSLGIAMTEGYKKQLSEWGSLTKIEVNRYNFIYNEDTGMGTSEEKKLDDTVVETISNIAHVRAVTPILNVSANLKSGKYQTYITIYGIDPDTIKYFDFPEVEEGQLLSNDNPTALLFGKNSYHFYNPKATSWRYNEESPVDLMNDKVKITFDDTWGETTPKYDKLNVAGILQESNSETGYSVYGNIEQVKKWYKEKQKNNTHSSSGKNSEFSYESIWVSVEDIKYVKDVQDQIKAMGYGCYSLADSLDSMQETSNMLQLILGGIGAVSLLVSAIGIANTMIMSIYERTKEIGVMKVLGCLVTDIRKLFLFEASIIGFLGGIFGIGFSYLISFILNKYAPQIGDALGMGTGYDISVIPLWLALAAVCFAIAIGVISGFYPAKRATKISALEAMRAAE